MFTPYKRRKETGDYDAGLGWWEGKTYVTARTGGKVTRYVCDDQGFKRLQDREDESGGESTKADLV